MGALHTLASRGVQPQWLHSGPSLRSDPPCHWPIQAELLLDRGIHPLRIAEGYERACKVAVAHLQGIAHTFSFSESDCEPLVQTCMTTLSSKMCAAHPCCSGLVERLPLHPMCTQEAAIQPRMQAHGCTCSRRHGSTLLTGHACMHA